MEQTRNQRIEEETKKLKALLKKIPKEKLKAADGILKRIAFMQITLEDLEADINSKGTIEAFSQTLNIEYDRERPATKVYNTTIKNYTVAYKQLLDIIPDNQESENKDELLKFLKNK